MGKRTDITRIETTPASVGTINKRTIVNGRNSTLVVRWLLTLRAAP